MHEPSPDGGVRLAARPMSRLLSYLRPYRWRLTLACGSSVANKVLDLMPPLLVGWVVDSLGGQPPGWLAGLADPGDTWGLAVVLAALTVLIFGLESFFQWGYQLGFLSLAQRVQHDLRVDAYHHLQDREIAFFEEHRLGETLAILNDDVNQLERFLNTGFNELLQLLVLFTFAGSVLFGTSWQLALVGMAPIPLIVAGSLLYQRTIAPRYSRVRRAVGQLASRLENNIAGILVIKSFTAEDFEQQRVAAASQEYRSANLAAIRLAAVYVPLIRMAIALGFAGVLLVGSHWVLSRSGVISLGELVLFSMLIQRMLWPLTRIGTTLDELERARASARRVFGLLESRSPIQDPAEPRRLGRVRGEIVFDDVHFRYRHGLPVLAGLSFRVAPGESVGIAGPTGAGKSTLIKLLLRLYDVSSGAVRIDGVDLRELELDQLRGNIALVSQDVYLFHGSIYDNIAYADPRATPERVERAARQAQLHEFVSTLPEGYASVVGERGIKLSGGQRQRLSLARAILKDAPILVLDEATSSVDTETERAIQESLEQLTAGRTALIIAHRLSTIRRADRILVLADGRLAEEGRHEQLLRRGGLYADLWHVQAGELAPRGRNRAGSGPDDKY